MTIKLYDSAQSPNARKVRLLAAELDLPLERIKVDLAQGAQRTAEFVARNPMGRIPVIDDDGFVVWESAAILKYLASKRPQRGLLPSDAQGAAMLDQWLFWWVAHPEAALMALAYEKLVKPYFGQPGNDASIIREAETQIGKALPILDRQLEGLDYVLGTLSVVDFMVGPWLDVLPMLGVRLEAWPNLRALQARLVARPYWASA